MCRGCFTNIRDGRAPVLSRRRRRFAGRARVRRTARGRAPRGPSRRRSARQVGTGHRRRHDRMPQRHRRPARRRRGGHRERRPRSPAVRRPATRVRTARSARTARRGARAPAIRRGPRGVGNFAALKACVASAKKGARIVQVGTLPHEPLPFVVNELMAKELDLCGAFRWGIEFDWAVAYLSTRRVDVRPLLTEQFPCAMPSRRSRSRRTSRRAPRCRWWRERGSERSDTRSSRAAFQRPKEESCVCSRSYSRHCISGARRRRPSVAQQKFKWAHVYEISEPYHTESGGPLRKSRSVPTASSTSRCFPPPRSARKRTSTGLTLGTVDMIISGPSFAARNYPRLGIAYYPFIFATAIT